MNFIYLFFSKAAVMAVARTGKICVLDIDTEGVKQVKKSDLTPVFVFIKPPTIDDLENRLRERGTETEESLQRRLSCARKEIEYGIFKLYHFKLFIKNFSEIP